MALTLGLIYSVYDRQLNFYIKATSVLSFSGIVLNICNILMKKELLVPIETSPAFTDAYIDGPLTICLTHFCQLLIHTCMDLFST